MARRSVPEPKVTNRTARIRQGEKNNFVHTSKLADYLLARKTLFRLSHFLISGILCFEGIGHIEENTAFFPIKSRIVFFWEEITKALVISRIRQNARNEMSNSRSVPAQFIHRICQDVIRTFKKGRD